MESEAPLATYAIGDVHGRSDLLAAMLDAVRADADGIGARLSRLVLLGDYVDHGPDSRGAVELVMGDVPGFETVALKGNHEDLLVRAWQGDRGACAAWLPQGGLQTLLSYGWVPGEEPVPSRYIPEAHADFLSALPTCFDDGRHMFVHAGIDPALPLEAQDPKSLMWIRRPFLTYEGHLDRLVIHGHSISEAGPEVRPNRIGLDTGAYRTGVLTCAVFEPLAPTPRFIQAVDPSHSADKNMKPVILSFQDMHTPEAPWTSISRTP